MVILFLYFVVGIVFGSVLASIFLIIFLTSLLPKPEPPCIKHPLSLDSASSSTSTSSPSVQLWVTLLPSMLMPYSINKHTSDMTYSARITVMKQMLVVEYPDRNIVEEEMVPADLQFLEYKDMVDMNRAGVSFLPNDITNKDFFSKKFPLLVEEQRQFVIFCSSSREKEDLYRSLVDSSTYVEDSLLDNNCEDCTEKRAETQAERRNRFMTFMGGKNNWREKDEICRCCVEPLFQNESLDFINSMLLHLFGLDQHFAKDFVHKKLVNKLGKIKYFPDHFVEDIDVGNFPPLVEDVKRPYQDTLGLFLPFIVDYRGVSSATMLLDKKRTEEELKLSIIKRLKNLLFSNIGFKVNILSLKGNLCFNIGQNKTDRIWFGFSSEPEMELQLLLMIGGKLWQSRLVDKLLQLGINRMKTELRQSLVLPNMDDIPVKFLSF